MPGPARCCLTRASDPPRRGVLVWIGVGIWGPIVKEGLISRRLQPVQNQALRVVTGCHQMASGDHVHQECQVLPVVQHSKLLCSQFLASTLRSHHPSHHVVTSSPGPRKMKRTLYQSNIDEVRPFLVDNKIPASEYKSVCKRLHTSMVESFVNDRPINPVLNTQPPPVAPSISRLPRQTQRVLAQLRSGFSSKLASYQARIGISASSTCPDCGVSPQTSAHLFECSAHPTQLGVIDLWNNPIRAASFLSSTPSFSDLALPPPPPALFPTPPPPPQPPPIPPLLPPPPPPLLSPPSPGVLTPTSLLSSISSGSLSPSFSFSPLSFSLPDSSF